MFSKGAKMRRKKSGMKSGFLILVMSVCSSCITVSNGYFAKEADFFLMPGDKILFLAQTGDLQKDALLESALCSFFSEKGFSSVNSLKQIDPMGRLNDAVDLSQYLNKQKTDYVVAVAFVNSETEYGYIPPNTHTYVYNYGGYITANSYTTGGYLVSSTIKTFSVTVSDSRENRYALFEMKADYTWNLFEGDRELFTKMAQNIFENLTVPAVEEQK